MHVVASLLIAVGFTSLFLIVLALPSLFLGIAGNFKTAFLLTISIAQTLAYFLTVRLRFLKSEFLKNLGITKEGLIGFIKVGLKYWVIIELTAIVWDFIVTKLGFSPSGPGGRTWITTLKTIPLFYIFISQAFLGPLGEEIFYRGYVFKYFRQKFSFSRAALISAAIFAVVHLNPTQLPLLVLHGYLYAMMFEETKSVISPYTSHMLKNFLTILFQVIPVVWYVK